MWPKFELLNLSDGLSNYTKLFNGATVTILILVLCFTNFWRRKFTVKDGHVRQQRRIPGPGLPILGRLTNVLAMRNPREYLNVMEKWCREYGPVCEVKFGPTSIIMLSSPEYAQKLLSSTDMNHLEKGFMYKPFKPFWKDGLLISSGEKWKSRRKLLDKHFFSYKTLLSYIQIFNEEGSTLVQAVAEMGNTQEGIDVDYILKNALINSVSRAALGNKHISEFTPINEGDITFFDGCNKGKEIAFTRVLNPWLLFEPLWKLHPLSKVSDSTVNTVLAHITNAIQIDAATPNENISLQKELLAAGVPFEGVLEEAFVLFTAGFETTAVTLEFVLFYLALNPHHQDLCRKEVDSLFLNGDENDDISYQDLAKLKYLEMCVNETLRLFPTVFQTMRKLRAPLKLEEDLELPAGSEVLIFTPAIHKDSKYYPEPEKYIPERFLPEEIKKRHQYAFIPFSGGPRKCIGLKFAMMQMISTTAKLLRHYVISTKNTIEDVVLLPYITSTPESPLKFHFERRPQPYSNSNLNPLS